MVATRYAMYTAVGGCVLTIGYLMAGDPELTVFPVVFGLGFLIGRYA